jgi:hypothetical protein
MPVRVVGAGRGDRDRWMGRRDEGRRRRGLAAVMGDLEEVHARDAAGEHDRVDVLLDVAGQQESATADLAVEHDRHVVDAGPRVGWLTGHGAPIGPEDSQADRVNRQAVTRRQTEADRCARPAEALEPGRIARARAAHARLEDPRDPIAIQQQSQAGHVVLMGMTEDDGIDPSIPGRDVTIEHDEQAIGIRTAIDEQTATVRALHQDRIALADIEHGDPHHARGPDGDDGAGDRQRGHEGERGRSPQPGRGRRRDRCRSARCHSTW